jgi:hypothetical protein
MAIKLLETSPMPENQTKPKFSLVERLAMWCSATPARMTWGLARDESSVASSGIYGFITPEHTDFTIKR